MQFNINLITFWTPLDIGGASIQTQDDKSWLPSVIFPSPYISISVLGARNDSVGFWSPVDSSYNLIVLENFNFQSEKQKK